MAALGKSGPGKAFSIHGSVAPGFDDVREAFVRNFETHGEQGAATAIYVDGRKVVDLWGGIADHRTGRPWTENMLSLIWSATKGAAAMCIHLLAQRGKLDLDAPVARYWPEFAQNGKAEIPVWMILAHQSGVCAVDGPLTRDDLLAGDAIERALEAQKPLWEPGTRHGYHAITIGHLLMAIVKRVDGRSLGRFFAEEIARPLDLAFHIGLPEALAPRVSHLIEAGPNDPGVIDQIPPGEARSFAERYAAAMADPSSLTRRALSASGFETPEFNKPEVWAAELPWGNGICEARALAKLYAAAVGDVDGFRLLSDATLDRALTDRGTESDAVLIYPTRWSDGFMLPTPMAPWMGPTSFGFTGAGGHVGMGDRVAKVGFAYTMTRMFPNLTGDPRPAGVMKALQKALG